MRVVVEVPDADAQAFKAKAKEQGDTMAGVVRQAIKDYLKRKDKR
jgi:hypothetical protein